MTPKYPQTLKWRKYDDTKISPNTKMAEIWLHQNIIIHENDEIMIKPKYPQTLKWRKYDDTKVSPNTKMAEIWWHQNIHKH